MGKGDIRIMKVAGKSLADDIIEGGVRPIRDRIVSEPPSPEGEFSMRSIDVPADGSCFFQSIAICMTESMGVWYEIEELRSMMEIHWEKYHETRSEMCDRVTSSLVRYMCAVNIDKDILDTYNAEAEYRRDTLKEKGVVIYKGVRQLKDHILGAGTWADHASFNAFLKSLNYKCAVIVFDPECGGVKYLPPEWTAGKSLYIFLLRRVNHYSVLRVRKGGANLPLCVSYDDAKEFVKWMKDTSYATILCEF